jgi:hypothetical protein
MEEKKMDRRKFLTSLQGGCGIVAAAALVVSEAHASTLFDSATGADRIARPDLSQSKETSRSEDLPADGAKDVWHRGFAHRGWGPRRHRRVARCTVRRNRYGRRVRVCRF